MRGIGAALGDMNLGTSKAKQWDVSALLGMERNLQDLDQLLSSERVHPVVMLEGRDGLGKRHLAVWMAAHFLCVGDRKNAKVPCGACLPCREVFSGSHPDVMILDEHEASIKTAEAEVFREHFNILSSSGMRIGIIMNADRLTTEAANRLLKTLEEPSSQARIILTSSRPLALPATVLGRCLRWRLGLPPREEVVKWTQSQLSKLGRGPVSLPDVRLFVQKLGYSPGRIRRKIDAGDMLGSDFDGEIRTLLKSHNITEVLKAASDLARVRKAKVPDLLNAVELELSMMYRDVLIGGGTVKVEDHQAWSARKQRRSALSSARRQAILGRVVLNSQLVAESVGLSRWEEGVI